ncbi:MAG: hypothetical protein ABIH83_00695 [Candidatus Micrarchaeota archaeon]
MAQTQIVMKFNGCNISIRKAADKAIEMKSDAFNLVKNVNLIRYDENIEIGKKLITTRDIKSRMEELKVRCHRCLERGQTPVTVMKLLVEAALTLESNIGNAEDAIREYEFALLKDKMPSGLFPKEKIN